MTPLPKLKPRNVDMAPEAIDQRLREMGRLSALGFALEADASKYERLECETRAQGFIETTGSPQEKDAP